MKTKIRRVSKRTLAVLLGVLMLVSTLVVGQMITANAWGKDSNWNTSNSYIKGSFDSWYEHKTNSNGYADFDVTTAGNYSYIVYAENNKYSDQGWSGYTEYNDGNDYNYSYTAHKDGGTNCDGYFPAGQYVLHLQHTSDDWKALSYELYRKKAQIDAGWDSGAWSNYEMTYDSGGDGVYKYTISGNGKQFRFRPKFVDGGTTHNYRPAGTGSVHSVDMKGFGNYDGKYDCKTSDSDGNANNYFYIDTLVGASYTIWLKNGGVWLTYTEYTPKIYGALGGNWSSTTTNMTATGTAGVYSYTYSATNGGTQYYRFKINNDYYKYGSGDGDVSTDSSNPTVATSNGTSDPSTGAFRFSSTSGKSYTVYVKLNGSTAPTTWVEDNTPSYYLTGWLNGASETGNNRAFTNTSGNTWTYSFSPSSDQGGYQYMTIKQNDGTVYHPATHGSGSGTVGSMTDTVADGDNKWKVAAVSGQTVNLTWDSSTHVLSWTVTGGGGGSSSSWRPDLTGYQSDNDDTNYRLFTSVGSETFASNAVTYDNIMHKGNSYWVEFNASQLSLINASKTSWIKFYCALSNSTSKGNIATGSATIYTTDCDTTNFVNAAGCGQQANGLDTGSDRKYARCEFKNTRTENVTGFGVLIDASTWNNPKYYFYTNEVGSSGGDTISSVKVYAKDGAAPINWDDKGSGGASDTSGTKYNYAAIATTTLTATGVTATTNNCGNASSQYRYAEIAPGTAITVTTTIANSNSWRSKYYVAGWCINGVTYKEDGAVGVNTEKRDTGVYTMTYTIPAEMTVDYLEITPIYYLRDNSNCITFYLEGYNDIIDKWGNTPFIYPFYGNNDNVDNSFGCYPGQPMVYTDGKYSIEIPIESDNILNTNNKNGTAVKGITINNGYADHVHRNMIYGWTDHDNDADHRQTYDYDDFSKIYEECLTDAAGNQVGHPNSIIFRIQDETKTYNRYTYGGTKSGARVLATKASLSSTDLTNINSNNGWELLKNRYDQPIDLFGNVVTAPSTTATTMDNKALRVVSTGYNANIAGDYGTSWKVYKYTSSTKFDLIQDSTNDRYGAPPSIFLLRGTSSGYDSAVSSVGYPTASHSVDGVGNYTDSISKYEGLYKAAKAYVNKPVYITYEKDAQDTRDNVSGTGAYRLDGRWYYTHATDNVQSTVGIEYYNKSTGKWVSETPTASTGLGSSGNKVVFNSDSYAGSSNQTTSKSVVIGTGATWNFTATAGTGYIFDSWQIKYSETSYDKIEGAEEAASIKATANYTLVARFMPVVTGSLTITHKLAPASTGEGTVGLTATVGSTAYNGTVDESGVARVYINSGISNSNASTNVTVTLTTTPQYDGKVTAFGYDSFNASPSSGDAITATIKNGSNTNSSLPGGDNEVRKSVFSFTVGQLFAGATLVNDTLAYTSTVTETPHYYNFTYNFTTRGNATANNKSYTSKGKLSQKDYKAYVTNQATHTLDSSIVTAMAPFESNFLKANSLTPGSISYNSGTHTFSATSSFAESASAPVHHVVFKLPYDYYTTSSGSSYKKYNASNNTYNKSKAVFDLAAKFNEFVTIGATETTPGTQTENRLNKVSDPSDVNHTGNDFLTAPDTLSDNGTTMYFKYWKISRLSGEDEAGEGFAKIYYPDFHYRVYGDYFVEAVYGNSATESWRMKYSEDDENIGATIMYIGSSRNQWNSSSAGENDSQDTASDLIYNDFIFNFADKGTLVKGSTNEIGMVIQRVKKDNKWVEGIANVSDMSSYQTSYPDTTENQDAIKAWLGGSTKPSGCVKTVYSTSDLNTKNFMEKCYVAYSAYGQTVDSENGDAISFKNDNANDNYVYRAYAYMKASDGKYYLSDPAYFCMKYISSKKQFE